MVNFFHRGVHVIDTQLYRQEAVFHVLSQHEITEPTYFIRDIVSCIPSAWLLPDPVSPTGIWDRQKCSISPRQLSSFGIISPEHTTKPEPWWGAKGSSIGHLGAQRVPQSSPEQVVQVS
ncbi:hypothetical protein QAD02_005560 [Eretmocerus hayati]|uniref:Uncharacterized protein n=1 Tax=Eretmocerus hayati TaxID=131215 RepID=A0ACC2NTV5_9HYME|nr:hypothetical protein QAD02_005560 [Eretmocerus hayati]